MMLMFRKSFHVIEVAIEPRDLIYTAAASARLAVDGGHQASLFRASFIARQAEEDDEDRSVVAGSDICACATATVKRGREYTDVT